MSLKTLVKVSEITNLSDARYCAGMGVEMLGFSLDENHPKFIDLSKMVEIINWLNGIKVVGEFTGSNIPNINYLAEQLKLDFIQLNYGILSVNELKDVKGQLILKIDIDQIASQELSDFLKNTKDLVSHYVLMSNDLSRDQIDLINKLNKDYPLIIETNFTSENMDEILADISPAGINLKGGSEIRPGFKDYTELSDILELLEENS